MPNSARTVRSGSMDSSETDTAVGPRRAAQQAVAWRSVWSSPSAISEVGRVRTRTGAP